jgi:hypothetical protein
VGLVSDAGLGAVRASLADAEANQSIATWSIASSAPISTYQRRSVSAASRSVGLEEGVAEDIVVEPLAEGSCTLPFLPRSSIVGRGALTEE